MTNNAISYQNHGFLSLIIQLIVYCKQTTFVDFYILRGTQLNHQHLQHIISILTGKYKARVKLKVKGASESYVSESNLE